MSRIASLPKSEHLTGEIRIQQLFSSGKAFLTFPIRVVVRQVPEDTGVRVLFSVPKKQFKRAVDRNHYKRFMREAYRQNKQSLIEQVGQKNYGLHIALTMINNKPHTYNQIYTKIISILEKLEKELK